MALFVLFCLLLLGTFVLIWKFGWFASMCLHLDPKHNYVYDTIYVYLLRSQQPSFLLQPSFLIPHHPCLHRALDTKSSA